MEKQYRLRCGIVVAAESEAKISPKSGIVRVVDIVDEKIVDGVFDREMLLVMWTLGAENCLFFGEGRDPLNWKGGFWGPQFDVVEEVLP